MYRNTFLNVDLTRLKNNAKYFMGLKNKGLIAVVKANGYGIIDYMEAKALNEIGVEFFAVSSLDEALVLRKHKIKGNIICLGYIPESALDIVKNNDITMVSISKEYVENADIKGIKMHLKLNTGMNRLGIKCPEAKQVLDLMLEKGALVEGVMSHFSSADEDLVYSQSQYQLFKDTVLSLNYDFKYIHMAATDGEIKINDDICNYCRIGIGLLGFNAYDAPIKPVVSLTSEVIMVKQVEKGETVSYNRRYTSDGSGYILTLPIGYSDGFRKKNVNKKVYIEGSYYDIIGNICMDMLMIHTDKYYPLGTTVELLGDHVDVDTRAKELELINYELLVGLNDRISRRYYEDGKLVDQVELRFA